LAISRADISKVASQDFIKALKRLKMNISFVKMTQEQKSIIAENVDKRKW